VAGWAVGVAVVALTGSGVASAQGDAERPADPDPLVEAWRDARARLAEHGIRFEAFYTLDVLSNVEGGLRRATSALGDVDLILRAELEPLLGWPGARVLVYGLGTHGDRPSRDDVGDLQGVSSIEAVDTWKVFEAWIEQELGTPRVALLAGLYDVTSEFDVLPTANLFLHSSRGTGAAFGLSGRNGPSTFPTTSVSGRLAIEPTDGSYARIAVADGVSGDVGDPRGTEIHFDHGDGVLVVGELGLIDTHDQTKRVTGGHRSDGAATAPTDARHGKLAVGAWGYTSQFQDLVRTDGNGGPRTRQGSWGAYLLAEGHVFHEHEGSDQGLTLFARAGIADPRTTIIDGYLGGGTVYRGAIPGREADDLGFGISAAHLGPDYRKASRRAGTTLERWEIALEWSYLFQATPWLSIQPDAQLVIHPGGNADLDDAVVVGARFVLSL
jgi:porin